MPGDFTKAYRSYLAELERECRQTLGVISFGIVALACVHPLLLAMVIPTTLLAWWFIYHNARTYLIGVLYRTDILKRSLKFEDYDPNLLDAMELQPMESYRLDSSLRLRPSPLETFWRSYEASCRLVDVEAINGLSHLGWMMLPLATMTIGLGVLPQLVQAWNWLHVDAGLLQILAWLLGIGAATLGKYVIQLALVTAAWDAVVRLPADEPDPQVAAREAQGTRDEFFSWKLPPDATPPTGRMARRNGTRS